MLLKLSSEIKDIIQLIKNKGYEAYVVGGHIRDLLLNKLNYDVDITTNAKPNVLKEILKDYNLDENFTNLGSVKFDTNNFHVEITTFRKEFEYINHRRPNKVEFVDSLKEDLIRRDFTINALCSDGNEIIDMFEGIKDLNNSEIKTIGDPNIRFEEDALRILRAFRFSSKLNFKINDSLNEAIYAKYKYLSVVSFDTKYKELKGILDGEKYLKVLIKYKEILKEIFDLKDLKIDLFNNKMTLEEKEALFFYYSDNISVDNKYLVNKNLNFISDKIDIKRKLMKYGKENIFNILFFKKNILKENEIEYKLLNEILENNECYNLKMLAINGKDLLNIGIKNHKIGKCLNLLLEVVIENKCSNDKKELLRYLKNNILD